MAAINEPPLDEIQWRHPVLVQSMQGIHSNSVLFYFAESPFFDRTSNNAVLASQAMFNANMFHLIQTREAFEGRLREMSGLEFIVAQEPAEMAPGTGTGVWVIRKQTRQKRENAEDKITIHSTYYVIGENVYMAPTLAQVLGFRMATVASALGKCFPAADNARAWSPSLGHLYKTAPAVTNPRTRNLESKEATPMPESQGSKGALEPKKTTRQALDSRLAEHSFMVHMQHGGDYMDENPITGKPGEFHLSSTGRKDNMKLQIPGITALNTSFKSPATPEAGKKDAKAGDKTPKTPTGTSKSKRKRKSEGGSAKDTTTNNLTTTPTKTPTKEPTKTPTKTPKTKRGNLNTGKMPPPTDSSLGIGKPAKETTTYNLTTTPTKTPKTKRRKLNTGNMLPPTDSSLGKGKPAKKKTNK
ncbi:Uu.00g094230.m01.CDS01 [Anthostomella pinea]|uniref:Mediator of RNA polymerase II transcription subunit 6 n=1 Tax=Anthostomella pinea TaxID=933095 RepID=A0AAI8YKN4_9PEZI|nr:Uu.00g094230.m01.CDS01 [Anthostomella pinea]